MRKSMAKNAACLSLLGSVTLAVAFGTASSAMGQTQPSAAQQQPNAVPNQNNNQGNNQGGYNGGGGGYNNGGGFNGGGYGGGGYGGGGNRRNGGGGGFGGGGNGGGFGGGGGFNGGGGGGNRRNNRRNGGGLGGNGPIDPTAGQFNSTTQPDDVPIPTPPDITASYLTVTNRSIFFKGYFNGAPGGAPVQPPTPEETILVFDGASRTNGVYEGFVENQESGVVTVVHIGDPIAKGKVKDLSLDNLDYEAGIRIFHLGIGQNLAGDQVFGGTGAPTTLPTVDMSGPGADLLRKMMLRRIQELNGGLAPAPAPAPAAK
jgi:hypothetical protein